MRKAKQILAFTLAIFMLASLMIPVSAEEITPDPVETVVGYSDALVTTTVPNDAKSITTIPSSKKIVDGELVANDGFEKGDDPTGSYTISSVAEFLYFDQLLTDYYVLKNTTTSTTLSNWYGAFEGVTVYLTKDLDFKAAGVDTITPVGDYTTAGGTTAGKGYYCIGFAGVFDGMGHTIDNVTIVPESGAENNQLLRGYYGLFACIAACFSDTGIKNLIVGENVKFDLSSVTTGNQRKIGGVVGAVGGGSNKGGTTNGGSASFTNVMNKADGVTGGIVAFAKAANVTFTNCTNAGDLQYSDGKCKYTSSYHLGGILGVFGESSASTYNRASLEISNCVNKGDFLVPEDADANLYVGSMVGVFASASNYAGDMTERSAPITGCYNEGAVITNSTVVEKAIDAYGTHIAAASAHWNISVSTYTDNSSFAAKMNVAYYQLSSATYKNTSDKDCYSLRLIALHNAIDTYADYGYDIEISYADPENAEETITVLASVKNQKKVNTSIKVTELDKTTLDANVTEVTAADLDASYQYVSAVCIDNIPVAYGELTVTVTPKLNDGTVTGAPITFTVTPDYAN